MKRARLLAPMIALCILLSACGGGQRTGEEKAALLRTRLLETEEISFTASLRCDYGDRIWDCVLGYQGGIDSALLTVVQPEEIAGLEVYIEASGAQLHFDGAALDTGPLWGSSNAAVQALPRLLQAWCSAYVADCYSERLDGESCTVLVLEEEENKQVLIWFTEDAMPIKAELQKDGSTDIFCSFLGFSYT